MKTITYLILIAIVLISMPACTKTYKIGDKCPAGGIVFYDKGKYTDGWRYLSAAPANAEFESVWSNQYFDVAGTQPELGTGKSNTQLIIKEAEKWDETDTAAQQCANLKIGNFSDWFLPSNDELAQMNDNLKLSNIGDFKDKIYWSSMQNEDDESSAFTQFFGYDDQGGLDKGNVYMVRAMRAF